MAHEFDPGYTREPYQTLASEYPGPETYPPDAFRTEWGPIFHRGRLDGSARILGIGQDPAQHEAIARRILVGEAGQRVQGFLAKLGLTRSYVLVNTWLYSAYNQALAQKHNLDSGIVAYRHGWLDGLLIGSGIRAVVAFGDAAEGAWQAWAKVHPNEAKSITFVKVYHPTWPSHATQNKLTEAEAVSKMLQNWNAGVGTLKPAIGTPDVAGGQALYGAAFKPEDLPEIPERDLPAGLPAWMQGPESWADRPAGDALTKRRTIVVAVPEQYMGQMG